MHLSSLRLLRHELLVDSSTWILFRELLTVDELLQAELFWIDTLAVTSWYNQLTLLLRPQSISLQALEMVNVVEKGCPSSLASSRQSSISLSTGHVGRWLCLSLSLYGRVHLHGGSKASIDIQALLLVSPFLSSSVSKIGGHGLYALRFDVL